MHLNFVFQFQVSLIADHYAQLAAKINSQVSRLHPGEIIQLPAVSELPLGTGCLDMYVFFFQKLT